MRESRREREMKHKDAWEEQVGERRGENESLVEAAIKDEMGERGREVGYRLVEVSVTILESEEVEREVGEG